MTYMAFLEASLILSCPCVEAGPWQQRADHGEACPRTGVCARQGAPLSPLSKTRKQKHSK